MVNNESECFNEHKKEKLNLLRRILRLVYNKNKVNKTNVV